MPIPTQNTPVLVIFIRFSFIGRGDWLRWRNTDRGSRDPAQVGADLFDPKRLARRFASFETLTLPSLMAQTDRDFRCVILTSPQMPPADLARLRALIEPLPGAELLMSEAATVEDALSPLVTALQQEHGHLVQIRLDDDDALSVNFIARLRQSALRMRNFPHYAISASRGLVLWNWEDEPVELRQTDVAFMSVGTAARLPEGMTIFHHHHGALPRHFPALQDGRLFGFLYQRWSSSDSDRGPGRPRRSETVLPPAKLARVIEREFPFLVGVDLSSLRLPDDQTPG